MLTRLLFNYIFPKDCKDCFCSVYVALGFDLTSPRRHHHRMVVVVQLLQSPSPARVIVVSAIVATANAAVM